MGFQCSKERLILWKRCLTPCFYSGYEYCTPSVPLSLSSRFPQIYFPQNYPIKCLVLSLKFKLWMQYMMNFCMNNWMKQVRLKSQVPMFIKGISQDNCSHMYSKVASHHVVDKRIKPLLKSCTSTPNL